MPGTGYLSYISKAGLVRAGPQTSGLPAKNSSVFVSSSPVTPQNNIDLANQYQLNGFRELYRSKFSQEPALPPFAPVTLDKNFEPLVIINSRLYSSFDEISEESGILPN